MRDLPGLDFFSFTYFTGEGSMRRVVFSWVGLNRASADTAFFEAFEVDPEEVGGLRLEVKELTGTNYFENEARFEPNSNSS